MFPKILVLILIQAIKINLKIAITLLKPTILFKIIIINSKIIIKYQSTQFRWVERKFLNNLITKKLTGFEEKMWISVDDGLR